MIHYNNYKLPPGLEYVGDGFTVRKTSLCTGDQALRFMEGLCKHLIAHPDPTIVPVYSFEYIGDGANNTYKYQYDMMRLGSISETEEQIIWQVGDAWRSGLKYGIINPVEQFLPDKASSFKAPITVEQAWEQYPELMKFLDGVVKLNRYHDLHGENVMLDNDAQYRLVDLEGFKNPPLSLSENDWITR
jgi:hypothetical protein